MLKIEILIWIEQCCTTFWVWKTDCFIKSKREVEPKMMYFQADHQSTDHSWLKMNEFALF